MTSANSKGFFKIIINNYVDLSGIYILLKSQFPLLMSMLRSMGESS